MPVIIATALSVGVFAGIATWLLLVVGTLLLWGAFAAWASFFAMGGEPKHVVQNIVSNAFGVFVAWATTLAVLGISTGLPFAIWAGIAVGVSVFALIVTSSRAAILGFIPAIVFGYATFFGYISQTPEQFSLDKLTSASLENGLILTIISMAVGTLFGIASVKGTQLLAAAELGAEEGK